MKCWHPERRREAPFRPGALRRLAGAGALRSTSTRPRRSLSSLRRCLLARGGCWRRYEVICVVVSESEISHRASVFSSPGCPELSKKRLNETESERGALRAARMLDEPLITRARREDDAVARSRSIYRCAHRRYPVPAPVASFLPHIVDTPDLVSRENTQRRRRGVRHASPAQGLERKAKKPRKPRLPGHR